VNFIEVWEISTFKNGIPEFITSSIFFKSSNGYLLIFRQKWCILIPLSLTLPFTPVHSMMKKVLLTFALLLLPAFVSAQETKVFKDPFAEWVGKLQTEWTWLKEVPEQWRITKEGLEVKMIPTPNTGTDVRNILFRKMPKIAEGDFTVSVEVKASQPYSNQYQQTGLYWMRGDRTEFKFVMERIDGRLCVFPGDKPLTTEHAVLRFRVVGNEVIAECQPNATGEFIEAFRRALPPRNDDTDRIGLQCWHGPADKETWIQYRKFEITKPQ